MVARRSDPHDRSSFEISTAFFEGLAEGAPFSHDIASLDSPSKLSKKPSRFVNDIHKQGVTVTTEQETVKRDIMPHSTANSRLITLKKGHI